MTVVEREVKKSSIYLLQAFQQGQACLRADEIHIPLETFEKFGEIPSLFLPYVVEVQGAKK
jgi:hypothetical protein